MPLSHSAGKISSALLFAFMLVQSAPSQTRAAEHQGLPQDHEYQKKLRVYLATLKEADLALPILPALEMPKVVPGDLAYRAWVLTSGGGYGTLQTADLRIPAKHFTLAGIENGKDVFRPPITSSISAWLTEWDYPFNPYRGNKALKRRAFVANAVDMMMHDQLHEADPKGKASRSDFLGGTLIWLGYDYGVCKDAIPADARAAYETGLKKLVKRLNEWGPRRAMTDMDLFAPVGLHYCAQATGDPEIKRIAEAYTRAMLEDRRLFHPAGYFVDCGIFDASYNGISLYFTAWAASATGSPLLREALDKTYRLKSHLMLPEPDGTLRGPSHFNPRTSGDSANDQWAWRFRDCAAAMLTDEGLACAKPPTPQELAAAPGALLNAYTSSMSRAMPEVKATPWGERHWTMYPVFAEKYYRSVFLERYRKLEAEKSPLLVLPFRRQENFVRAFEDQFVIAKRPKFGVVIYTGPVSADQRQMKRPMGFGGGAISAFWTPEGGSVVLGRRRGIQGPDWDRLEEWATWPTHAVSAITAEGKLTSSARIQSPTVKSKIGKDSADVLVSGTLPESNLEQGKVLAGKVEYERRFEVSDAGVKIRTSLRSDRKDRFREVHEILPLYIREGRTPPKGETFRILYRDGDTWKPIPAEGSVSAAKLRVERFSGAVEITLDRARRVKLSPKEWIDGYMSSAVCRNIMIGLLDANGEQSFAAVDVSYTLNNAGKVAGTLRVP